MAILKAFLIPLLAKLGADEVKAWTPTAARLLMVFAVNCLPASDQERYREEWESDLLSFPGDISKIIRAAGFLCAAVRIWGTVVGSEILKLLTPISADRRLSNLLWNAAASLVMLLYVGLDLVVFTARALWGEPSPNAVVESIFMGLLFVGFVLAMWEFAMMIRRLRSSLPKERGDHP